MTWLFLREETELRIEARYDSDAAEYVLVVNWPDGHYQTERFRSQSEFRRRLVELQERIDEEGWLWFGSPAARDDWRGRTRH
jgi:hypothetical protein